MTKGTIERAFELAQSGHYRTVEEIQTTLSKEGCESVAQHLQGPQIRHELRQMMKSNARPRL